MVFDARVWSSFLQDWRGRDGGGGGGGGGDGAEGRGDETRRRPEREEGMRRQRRGSRGAGEWRRGDKALGTDRGMNNLSTLLMDRLGEKMKRDEAREREREERRAGGGRKRD